MYTSLRGLARLAVMASMLAGLGTTRTSAAEGAEVVVVSGTLDGQFLSDALFHVDDFWMRVASQTEFHRWLSQGLDRNVVISLTTGPSPFDDVENVQPAT